MENFTFYNPTRIVFGKGMIAELATLIPRGQKILMTYGGGSIKRNGVYDQVMAALKAHDVTEFGGIEPNPRYETLMKAVALAKETGAEFLLAVGGGSVLDGTKFIAAAIPWEDGDPWRILSEQAEVREALPVGSVLTLPATGSESNGNAVISRESTQEKLAFITEKAFPRFAVLDPETTFTLPERQTKNGIIDAFIHVMEQYLTYDVNSPLQDRQAEAILLTLIEEGPKVLEKPDDYDARANVMWAATQALNMLISCGVHQDWATHMIGHELTALYGIDHAQSLAIVYPAMMRYKTDAKQDKILQYADRVWGIRAGSTEEKTEKAIEKTETFFRDMGVKTRLHEYAISEGLARVGERIAGRGAAIGERGDIGREDIHNILKICS
jgi:NADP-dependent alcohol dehydrogenase